jgi:hypothetical protein
MFDPISRQFLFAPIFIPYLLNSHLTKVKESRGLPFDGYLYSLGAKNVSIIIIINTFLENLVID